VFCVGATTCTPSECGSVMKLNQFKYITDLILQDTETAAVNFVLNASDQLYKLGLLNKTFAYVQTIKEHYKIMICCTPCINWMIAQWFI